MAKRHLPIRRPRTASTTQRTTEPDPVASSGVFERLQISALKADPRNPRRHNREQIEAIARSIEAFGFNAPILVDKDKNIVAGHGRFEAAKLMDLEMVPVVCLAHLTTTQAQAYMLADNKLTDRSSWDDEALATHLQELSHLSLDFEIEAIGFEIPEIDFRIQSLDSEEGADEADTFAVLDKPAVSRLGDLWLLGDHRILCGDALDVGAFKKLLGNDKAAAVFTDPPYNVKVDGHVCGSGTIKHREFAMASGEMSDDQFQVFLSTVFITVAAFTQPGSVIYGCMDWRHIETMAVAGRAAGLKQLNLCVWVKSNGGMGSLYRSRHELVFVFRTHGASHRNNVQLGRYGRNRTNVWNYAGANAFPRKGRQTGLDLHPTTKPTGMAADAILDVTKRGDIVLDPFVGSGTTLLAAQRTGRRGYGIELDPLYVDTVIARWEQMSGQRARHIDGLSFREMAEIRLGNESNDGGG